MRPSKSPTARSAGSGTAQSRYWPLPAAAGGGVGRESARPSRASRVQPRSATAGSTFIARRAGTNAAAAATATNVAPTVT